MTNDDATPIAIDRTRWALAEGRIDEGDGTDLPGWLVTVDSWPAGWVHQDGERYFWSLGNDTANLYDLADPIPWEPSLAQAYARIRGAWALYWSQCASCGQDTTGEDGRWILPHADDIGVYCPDCRGVAE